MLDDEAVAAPVSEDAVPEAVEVEPVAPPIGPAGPMELLSAALAVAGVPVSSALEVLPVVVAPLVVPVLPLVLPVLVPVVLEPVALVLPVLPMVDEVELESRVPDAIVLELARPMSELAVPDPEIPSAAIVFESRRPVACMPWSFWNLLSADFVFGPMIPSTGPAL